MVLKQENYMEIQEWGVADIFEFIELFRIEEFVLKLYPDIEDYLEIQNSKYYASDDEDMTRILNILPEIYTIEYFADRDIWRIKKWQKPNI